ncbi:MAG: 50S ribosomal protein L29 [Candidatus Omnitrophica bacterium]|nr:50S ribosomal protein L29 [Candidatus Omnitrophota bacterium]
MKTKELRALSSEDLIVKEKSLKKDLFNLKYQRKIGRVEKPSQFKLIKRDVARILTILNEREKDGTKTK